MMRRLAAQAVFVLSAVLSSWCLILVWLNRATWIGDPGEAFGLPISALAFGAVGLIIARSQSDNLVGWVMLVFSASLAATTWGFEYALRDYTGFDLPGATAAAYLSHFANSLVLGSLTALALLFPSGEIRKRSWRIMAAVAGVGIAAILVLSVFEATFSLRSVDVLGERSQLSLAPPLIDGIGGGAVHGLAVFLGFQLVFVTLSAAIVRLMVEFVKGPATERLQLKWVLYVLVVGLGLMGIDQTPLSAFFRLNLNQIGGMFILIGVPVAMGIAISRYRLYEIDRIVSRTVTYAVVAGLLALVFATGVVLVPNLIPGLEGNALLVATSTLAAAALFNPVRTRLQRFVDRRFNRSKYDAERVVEDFTGTLRDRVDPDGVADGWIGVVSEALEPSRIAVWVRHSA